MLTHLTIENFAIIDRADLEFGSGLVALTGETGAGKSIVIDAVGALLGNRLTADVIRSGADQSRVEGIFDQPQVEGLQELLDEFGAAWEDGSLIVAREVNRSGRSVARINGRAVPQSALQRLGRFLMDLHGQGDHLTLLRPAEHLRLLDGFAGLLSLRDDAKLSYQTVTRLRSEIERHEVDQREVIRRLDLLKYQINEIDSARLVIGEDSQLRLELSLLANAEKLAVGIDEARSALTENEGRAAVESLARAARELTELARIDPALESDRETVEEALELAGEVSRKLRRYRENIEFNAARLEEIEERLEQLRTLQRKYGNTVEDVLTFGERVQAELGEIEHGEEHLAALRDEDERATRTYSQQASDLSQKRRTAAPELAAALEAELGELNMLGTRFLVGLRYEQDPFGITLTDGQIVSFGPTGIDHCEFLIAANAGEELKPLVRVVSGGETARLMLALKTVLSAGDTVPTLIFDEIDAGIGGQTAVVVGRKIANLARQRQIICVTHLPQLAAFADHHFSVRKRIAAGRTHTDVRLLGREERIAEIAGMFGGDSGRKTAGALAQETLEASRSWKAATPVKERGST